MTFWLWFRLNNVSFSRGVNAASMFGGKFIELIPVIDLIPAATASVFIIIAQTKVEDLLAGLSPEMARTLGQVTGAATGKATAGLTEAAQTEKETLSTTPAKKTESASAKSPASPPPLPTTETPRSQMEDVRRPENSKTAEIVPIEKQPEEYGQGFAEDEELAA